MANLTLTEEHKSFSPEGFRVFYALIHNRPPPKHAMGWIHTIFDAHAVGKGAVIEAFRGSTKTTTVTQTFAAFFLGHHPASSNLLIQVGDASAQDNAAKIAETIEHNPAWKIFFPHIVPDGKWGAQGYNIKRDDISYDTWARIISRRKDSSFIGLGRTSGAIIGKHPTGLLTIDDIDDENTTSSDREMFKTRNILTGTIFETITDTTWVIGIGTPWVEDDTIGYMKATGVFATARTPVHDDAGELVWPEKFDEEEIERHRKLAGEVQFARMFLLDLEKAKGINLKKDWLSDYPHEGVDDSWKVIMGMDFASTADKLKDRKADYCSISIGRLIPGGGVILVDGFRGHVSQGEAIQKLESLAVTYPTLQLIAVEKEGIGGQFVQMLQMYPHLPWHPATTADKISPNVPSARNKGDRFQKQMGPVFERGACRISNRPTKFLNIFRNEWISWPLLKNDDTLDSTYYMLYAATMFGGFNVSKGAFGTAKDWRAPKRKNKGTWKSFRSKHV